MDLISYVKGSSRVAGIIGNPVSHSISPLIHNTIAGHLKHDFVYVPFCVEKENLKACLEGAHALGIVGFNVTVPHKENILPYLTGTSEEAEQIGAVNTLKKTPGGYWGYNTDIIGLDKTFENREISLEGQKIVILGAGGAARSASLLAAKKGAKEIYIVNRSKSNAENLARHISGCYDANISVLPLSQLKSVKDCDIAIQTTPVGMHPKVSESVVEDKSFFHNIKIAVDIIYTPWQTKFLYMADQCLVKTINGFDMLIYQAVASYEIWNGVTIGKSDALAVKDAVERFIKG